MEFFTSRYNRRTFLRELTMGAASFTGLTVFSQEALRFIEDGDFAQELIRTPSQTEGPFYPNKMPLDTDNDLVIIKGNTNPALGEVTHLSGRILDLSGNPIRNATIEIWQVDNNAVYIHTGSDGYEKRDKNFQGFGRFETDSTGAYRFRTIKPVSYPGRTPHIHVMVKKGDRHLLTTQLYVAGEKQNDRDGVLLGIRDEAARKSVITPFTPLAGSKVGELEAKFNIHLAITPNEGEDHDHHDH